MRKRKNADSTILLVYKYRAKPAAELPPELWVIVKAQQLLWNKLVVLHKELSWILQTLPEADRKQVFAWWEWANQKAVAESGLNWETGPDVLDRFRAVIRRRKIAPYHGTADQIEDLTEVMIPHRYTAGGIDVSKLFSARATRFALHHAPDEHAYQLPKASRHQATTIKGVFSLTAKVFIPFFAELHRPLPEGLKVKRVQWCGRKHAYEGWKWWITISLEVPKPADRSVGVTTETKHIGLSWICEATETAVNVADIGGQRLAIPLEWSNKAARRDTTLTNWRNIQSLRTRADNCEKEGDEQSAYNYRRMAQRLSDRLIDRRRHLYRNIAHELATRFDVIVCPETPRLANHFMRIVAAPGELRQYIQQAATKCGAKLISQIEGDLEQTHVLRNSDSGFWAKIPDFTRCMRAVADDVQSG